MKGSYKFIGITLIVFCCLALSVYADMNIINEALSPFRNADISGLYDKHSFFFDLIIYAMAFIGITRVSLGKRFQGKGSNLLISSIGIILALSLALAGKSMGFSTKSFGPLSAFILILIVAMGAYQIIKSTGLNITGSGAIAFIIVYFIMRATTPVIFNWIGNAFPWIHLLLLIAFVFAIWNIIGKFSKPGVAVEFPKVARTIPAEMRIEKEIEKDINEEISVSERQIHTIKEMIHKIDEGFRDEEERLSIARLLDVLKAKKIDEFKFLWKIKEFTQKVENITLTQFKELKRKYKKLPKKARRNALNDLFIEEKKEKYVRNMKKITGFMESRHKYFICNLNQAQESLVKNKPDLSKHWLKNAFQMEKELEKYLRRIKGYNRAIEDLLKKLK